MDRVQPADDVGGMMGIFDRLFNRSEYQGDAVKALSRPSWWANVWQTDIEVGDGKEYGDSPAGRVMAVESNVWAYNCVKARMAAVAQAPMKLYRGMGEDKEEIVSHPVLDLLRTVNPINLNKRSFRRGIEQQLALHGRCLIQKVKVGNRVSELYILPMNFVEIEPDPALWIRGFTWLPTNTLIPRADVIDISYPALDGSVEADSPTAVALDAINRYNVADDAQASIDKRGGQKGGMVIHPQGTIPSDFERIRMMWDKWRRNPENAGRDMHVSAGFDYRADAFSATEMQREERLMRIANEIMAGYSVPPAIAGDYSDASKLANAAVQESSFWNHWAIDELMFIAEEMTYSLLHSDYPGTEDLYFEHDLSNIAALKEDADSRVQRAIALNAANLASVNEAREMSGLDRSEDEAANRILMEASQADVVADTTPLIAIVEQRNAGTLTDEAASTLLRISAPNLTDEQVAALLTRNPEQEEVNENAGTLQGKEGQEGEEVDDDLAEDEFEDEELEDEVDSILGEIDSTKADRVFDESKIERKGGQFAPKGGGSDSDAAPKRKRNISPATRQKQRARRVAKAREVESQTKADMGRLDEAYANADDKLKKRIDRLKERLQRRLTDAMTVIESNGSVMPKRKRKSAVDKLLGGGDDAPARNEAVENLPVVKAVDTSVDDPWAPPAAVRRAAEKGLELRREFNRGGTEIGVARARDLSNGKRIPPQTINRMLSYFARHEVDKKGENFGNDENPSPGYIAWLLWGGDAGYAWVKRIEKEYPAEVKAFPYVDPVGLVAESIDGDELGVIDALHRGGVHDGIKATLKDPVFSIAGKAYLSSEVMVRHAN